MSLCGRARRVLLLLTRHAATMTLSWWCEAARVTSERVNAYVRARVVLRSALIDVFALKRRRAERRCESAPSSCYNITPLQC